MRSFLLVFASAFFFLFATPANAQTDTVSDQSQTATNPSLTLTSSAKVRKGKTLLRIEISTPVLATNVIVCSALPDRAKLLRTSMEAIIHNGSVCFLLEQLETEQTVFVRYKNPRRGPLRFFTTAKSDSIASAASHIVAFAK